MSLTPWNRQEEWYQAMIDAAGSGGLPSVTSEDNGKVLAVKNGEWAADSNVFYVTFSYSGGMFYSDKTYAEISDAVASGREVLGIQGDYVYPYAKSSSGHTFLTLSPAPNQNLNGFLVSITNVVTQISRQTLPTVTASDAGKVLAVNNSGVWGAQNPRFVVTLTLTSESGGVADKTNAEIAEAFENGKSVWFTGNMNGMDGWFPLKAVTYLSGYYEYPFIGTEFDMISMNTTTISSTSKYMIAMSASDTPNNVFAMKAYPLDTPSANGVSF